MRAKKYAVFFLISFSMFLVTPPVIQMLEDAADIAYFFDIAEEEKKGETETAENSLVLTHHPGHHDHICSLSGRSGKHNCIPSHYLEIVLEKNFPPPELL